MNGKTLNQLPEKSLAVRAEEDSPRLVIEWDVQEALEDKVDQGLLQAALEEVLAGRVPGGAVLVGMVITDDRGHKGAQSAAQGAGRLHGCPVLSHVGV